MHYCEECEENVNVYMSPIGQFWLCVECDERTIYINSSIPVNKDD